MFTGKNLQSVCKGNPIVKMKALETTMEISCVQLCPAKL